MNVIFRVTILAITALGFATILFGYLASKPTPSLQREEGKYVSKTIKNPKPYTGTSYSAPSDIGTLHTTNIKTLWGFGPSKTLQWYGTDPSATREQRPAIMLFHGSGRDGRSMLDMWDELAEQHRIILIAPNAAQSGWSRKNYNAANITTLLQDAKIQYPIDMENVFLFGHSGGAKLVQTLANSNDGPWRAVGSHAGAMDHSDVVAPAATATQIFIFNGDTDQNYPVWYVEKSAHALVSAGHDVTLTTIEDHGHWYYEIGPNLAPIVWNELQKAAQN